MQKELAVLFLMALMFMQAKPQSYQGLVIDAETKDPLPFANIIVGGNSSGTVANVEGVFVLDVSAMQQNTTVWISYVGYARQKILLSQLLNQEVIALSPAAIDLKGFQVSTKERDPIEILKLVEERFEENHSVSALKQDIFLHSIDRTPIPELSSVKSKRSNFPGLTVELIDTLYAMMPKEFIDYRDVLLTRYTVDDESKIIPIQAISLEEGGQSEIFKQMEEKMSSFLKDVESAEESEDIYYKIRTGIFGARLNDEETEDEQQGPETDSIHFNEPTKFINSSITSILASYADIESNNLEFITDRRKYEYTINRVTLIGEELVYEIAFEPKRSGLFEGTMHVSMDTYGILQLDFAFADGKDDENIQLLGIGHSLSYKKAKVIFENWDSTYVLKYINAQKNEFISIDRNVSILKKQKRFLWDKELNQIKLDLELSLNVQSDIELLVIDYNPLDEKTFNKKEEPEWTTYRRELVNDPKLWNNRTVLAPTDKLQEYKRQR
ncbi:MAG: carboxypeptidase-like regulatory domain-containing protein [Salibacteraceae bacterium]